MFNCKLRPNPSELFDDSDLLALGNVSMGEYKREQASERVSEQRKRAS